MIHLTVSLVNHISTFLFTLSGAIAWHLLASRKSRGDSFFGVRVEAGFAQSNAGRAIFREFRFRLWSCAGLAAFLVQFLGPAGVGAGIFLSSLLGWFVFAEAHRRTLQQAPVQPVPELRIASLTGDEQPESQWLGILDWLAMIVPPAIPALALIAALGRQSIDGTLLFMILFAFVLGLTCAANQWALRFRARSSDWASVPADSRRFRTYLGVMMALAFTLPISMISLSALLPGSPAYFGTVFPLEIFVLFLIWRIRFWLTKHLDRQSIDPMSDSCWKWGWCYRNPSDPALVVPMRTGVGLSYNCGRLGIRIVYAVVMALTFVSLVVTTLLSSKLAHMVR
jgi:uncharacterized membrane protein